MTLRRTKSLDALAREVTDHDLVVVPEPPLADALNRRVREPRVGQFAVTPRRLAARRRESAEDRLAFLRVIERTDLDWRRAAAAVGEILQCWEHTGAPEAILTYDAFDTPAIRTALEAMTDLETTSRRLTDYEIDPGEYPSVGVVGLAQLTPLERSILPEAYESYSRFVDGGGSGAGDGTATRGDGPPERVDLPSLSVFDSPAAVVDAVLETVTAETADDVAIVLQDGGEYASLLESGLAAAEIPYYGGPGFADDRDLQCFRSLLRTVFAGSDVRVGDVRSILSHLELPVDVEHDEKRLFAVDADGLAWIRDVCERARDGTLADALTAYEEKLGRKLERLRVELDRLGLLEAPLTERVVDRLAFYVRAFEVPIERENSGVLLADATSAAYVDRPLVLCLGLDEGWTHQSPQRPWIDADTEFDRNLRAFQSLLQSGTDQHCLVVDSAGGRPVTPTLYLEEVLDVEFERFADLDPSPRGRPLGTAGDGFDRVPIAGGDRDETVETISQSSLNSFVNSPRDYGFSRLLEGPDRDYFAEGNLFHDFAEFYASQPSFCRGTDDPARALDPARRAEAVEAMVEATRTFHSEVDLDTRRTRYRIGLTVLAAFLADRSPDPDADEFTFLSPADGWGDNFFETVFDRSVDSSLAERWFDEPDLGVKGVIDLVADPTHLVDFKSGSKKRASTMTKRSAMDPPGDPPNYQALCYLTYWRSQRPDETLSFSFFHFLEALDAVVSSGEAAPDAPLLAGVDSIESVLEACTTTIHYRPISYEEFVTTREAFDGLCEEAANACNKTFSQLEFEEYLDVLDAHRVPKTRDADELASSAFGRALYDWAVDAVGDYKYVDKGCTQACRYLADLRADTYFEDDLDAFERFVGERIEDVNACRCGESRFPVAGLGGEPNWRRVDNRDLLLEDALRSADGGVR